MTLEQMSLFSTFERETAISDNSNNATIAKSKLQIRIEQLGFLSLFITSNKKLLIV